jgi:hypothetical protein
VGVSLLLGGRNGDGLERSASLSISISIHTEGPAPPQGIPVADIYIERRDIQRYREKNGRQRQGLRRAKENVIYRRQSKN